MVCLSISVIAMFDIQAIPKEAVLIPLIKLLSAGSFHKHRNLIWCSGQFHHAFYKCDRALFLSVLSEELTSVMNE